MNQILNEIQIKRYLDEPAEQFRIFDIPYLEKTKRCLDNFKIETITGYTNYGDNNLDDLKDYLKTIGSNSDEDIEIMEKTIKDLTETVMKSVDKKYTNHWLIVRTTTGSLDELSNTKRWHCDGNYFGHMYDKLEPRLDMFKFITILQGPGTFYLKTTPKERKLFESIQKEEFEKSEIRDPDNKFRATHDLEYRRSLDSRIKGIRVQAEKYQAAIFITHVNDLNKNVCGVHSEPNRNVPRMLFSIVPCTKEEAEADKKARKTIIIKKGGYIRDNFYLKYMKYKQKYLRLKALEI